MHPLLGRYSKDLVNEGDLPHDIASVNAFDRPLPNYAH